MDNMSDTEEDRLEVNRRLYEAFKIVQEIQLDILENIPTWDEVWMQLSGITS